MLQLTYISTAVPGLTGDQFNSLLLDARRRNIRDGVTGLLVYDGRRFLQALEGEEEAVRATFERIRLDTRHRAVVLLSSRQVGERAFGTWEMASMITRPVADNQTLGEIVDKLTECVTEPNARALFRSFARIDRAAA